MNEINKPMRTRQIFLIMLCLAMNIAHAQNGETYVFKPVIELKRNIGLQDPFLKPDGSRVKTKPEWAVPLPIVKTENRDF